MQGYNFPDVTVSVVVPETLLDVAVIVVDPVANELANPLKTAVLLMDATAASDELQITSCRQVLRCSV